MAEVERLDIRILRRTGLIVAVFLILLAEVVHAEMSAGRFRIDAQVVRSKKGAPVYAGYISDGGGDSAANIPLLVETLPQTDGKGDSLSPESSTLQREPQQLAPRFRRAFANVWQSLGTCA